MGSVYLQRSDPILGNYEDLASISIYGSSQQGFFSSSTESISLATIEKAGHSYWLVVNLPASGSAADQQVWACGVLIEYTPPSIFPGILNGSAAAFTPQFGGNDYTNDGRYLGHLHGPGGGLARGLYYAPVHLPQGAHVDEVIFYLYDANPTKNGAFYLQRTQLDEGNFENMAGGVVDTNLGWDTYFSSDIMNDTIDNLHYGYWVVWDLPATPDIEGRDFQIYYRFPLFLPSIRK
jgi:hypothetical protein